MVDSPAVLFSETVPRCWQAFLPDQESVVTSWIFLVLVKGVTGKATDVCCVLSRGANNDLVKEKIL